MLIKIYLPCDSHQETKYTLSNSFIYIWSEDGYKHYELSASQLDQAWKGGSLTTFTAGLYGCYNPVRSWSQRIVSLIHPSSNPSPVTQATRHDSSIARRMLVLLFVPLWVPCQRICGRLWSISPYVGSSSFWRTCGTLSDRTWISTCGDMRHTQHLTGPPMCKGMSLMVYGPRL